MLLLVFSKRCFSQILIITRTYEDKSHFARVGIFNSSLPWQILAFNDWLQVSILEKILIAKSIKTLNYMLDCKL